MTLFPLESSKYVALFFISSVFDSHAIFLKSALVTKPKYGISSLGAATSKYDELETLYGNVGKVIFDGLTNYERYSCFSCWKI